MQAQRRTQFKIGDRIGNRYLVNRALAGGDG
jgi:hypothetical protein